MSPNTLPPLPLDRPEQGRLAFFAPNEVRPFWLKGQDRDKWMGDRANPPSRPRLERDHPPDPERRAGQGCPGSLQVVTADDVRGYADRARTNLPRPPDHAYRPTPDRMMLIGGPSSEDHFPVGATLPAPALCLPDGGWSG
jgi:hypothetical protein